MDKSFVVDITGIKWQPEAEININMQGQVLFSKQLPPFHIVLQGSLINLKDHLAFTGRCRCKEQSKCARCLNDTVAQYEFEVHEIFSQIEESDESWFYSDDVVDLAPVVISNIAANRPMRVLCAEDCKGLCHKCGADLNVAVCDCDRAYRNPAFESLLGLFSEDEEV